MRRPLQGQYLACTVNGIPARSFIPAALPPEPDIRVSADLTQAFDQALLALGHFNGVLATLRDRDLLFSHMARLEGVLSVAIDGVETSVTDVLLDQVGIAPCGSPEDAQEAMRYAAMLESGFKSMDSQQILTPEFLYEQAAALQAPGETEEGGIRQAPLILNADSKPVCLAPPEIEIPRLMSEWDGFIHSTCGYFSSVPTVALAHLQLMAIAPFSGRNTQMARAAVLYLLKERGMLTSPVLPVSFYLYQHRESYWQLLRSTLLEGDWELWLAFFAKAIEEGAVHGAKVAKDLQTVLDRDMERIGAARHSASMLQVLKGFAVHPMTTGVELSASTGLMPMTVNKALANLMEMGLIKEVTGQKRYRIYSYVEFIDVLNDGTGMPVCH